MGSFNVRIAEDSEDKQRFMHHLLNDVQALEYMIDSDMIESNITRIGAEQELCFMDQSWSPAPVAMEVLEAIDDPHFVTEYARFNMEINLDPLLLEGDCFSVLHRQLDEYIRLGQHHAQDSAAKIIMTGILPTLNRSHINLNNLTPLQRYRDLTSMLTRMKGGKFNMRIKGVDELITSHEDSFYEACNTSFQVHYQVSPREFASRYNWAQAIAAPVLAACTYSPLLFGKRLWRETRIALFEQSIDIRQDQPFREKRARVSFGRDWVVDSIVELYKEQISRHDIILTADIDTDSLAMVGQGDVADLAALCIHNGTVYTWNRPCYGASKGVAHIRIENRIFPSGPTTVDEVANAAFWIGLMHGMPDHYRDIKNMMDFDSVRENFTKAARQGLGAQFEWVDEKRITSQQLILDELLAIAESGLARAQILEKDAARYLDIIRKRVYSGKTGSQWLLDSFNSLRKSMKDDEAIIATTAGMYKRQQSGSPVHQWELPEERESGPLNSRFLYIYQIMSKDLFTVKEDGLIDYVVNVMDWKRIRHIPVENDSGELVGLVTSKNLVQHYAKRGNSEFSDVAVRDIMTKNVITIDPESTIQNAVQVMNKNKVGCLPVTRENKLVGLVTEHDFIQILTDHLTDA